MSLNKKSPLLKFAIAACAVLPLLAGCGTPATPLCPDSGQGIGTSTISQVFNGAAAQKSCVVKASDLKGGQHYSFNGGALTINGDIPAHTNIDAHNAKLLINGNVPSTATIQAQVPIDTSTTTTLIPIWTGKSMVIIPQSRTHFEGYTYSKDTAPALTVNGDVATGARLTSNHGIHITGKLGNASINHLHSDSYNTLQTGPAAAPAF